MHRIDGPTAAPGGLFTEGDPIGGVPATIVSGAWANDMQEELMSILVAAGVAPVKGTQNQVLNSIVAALRLTTAEAQAWTNNTKIMTALRFADAFKGANVLASSSGYMVFPNGIILQWGVGSASTAGSAVVFPKIFPTGITAITAMHLGGIPAQAGTISFQASSGGGATFYNNGSASPVATRYIAIGF